MGLKLIFLIVSRAVSLLGLSRREVFGTHRQALQSKDNPADVINVALEALSAQRCELP